MTAAAARSVRPFTKAEAMAYKLGIHCASCGALLGSPGTPCDSCGKIPEITAPKMEKALNSALAIAVVQSQVLEAEAEALFRQAVDKWQDAAQVVHVARLQDTRDAAQSVHDEHEDRHRALEACRDEKKAAEDFAAARLAPQSDGVGQLAREVDVARDMDHGAVAVGRARQLHEIAKDELIPYQTALADAQGERKTAEDEVTRSEQRRDQLNSTLSDAQAQLENPGVAPLGRQAIIASPYLMLAEGRLDDAGIELAADYGRGICDLTGRTEEITAEARKQLLDEQEAAAKGKALHLRPGRDGMTVTPNPHNPNVPQAYHPPAPGSQAHPVTPAVTPGWAT